MEITNELDIITDELTVLDGGKAYNLYYNTSARIKRTLEKKKGLYKSASGKKIAVKLAFNEAVGGAVRRGQRMNSNYRELITEVEYFPVTYYGNGTIFGQDEIMNTGKEQRVSMVKEQLDAAQKKPFLDLARNGYGSGGDTSDDIIGIPTICSTTATQNVGGKSENDIVDANGVKAWKGNTYTTSMIVTPSNMRARIAETTYKDGANPTHCYLPLALLNAFKDACQGLQDLGHDEALTAVGFDNIKFDGVTFVADFFLPYNTTTGVGSMLIENENNVGFAVYPKADMAMSRWHDAMVNDLWAKTMKVMWMGNQICNDRRGLNWITNAIK